MQMLQFLIKVNHLFYDKMELIYFYILALLAEILGTIGGFGSSIFLIPIASLFFDFQTVLAITSILHVFSNSIKIVLFHKGIDQRLMLLMGVPSIVFVLIGSVLTKYFNLIYAEIFLGIFLVIFSTLFLLKPNLSVKSTSFNAIFGGSIAGFLAGIIGTGGAIRGICLAAFNLGKNAFIATSAIIDLGVDLTRSLVYISNGYLESHYYSIIPILLVIAFIGSYLGKWAVRKISQEYFKRVVLVFIMGIGIFIVVKFLK
jgi:uncharacterized protein